MKYLPQPDGYSTSDYNRNYISITPYNSLNWQETANKYSIVVPEIIDRTQGRSVCPQCKATYSGYEYHCTRKVVFHKPQGAWGFTRGYNPHCSDNFEQSCDGYPVWDLYSEFQVQQEFFTLLGRIGQLPNLDSDSLAKFADRFPPGTVDNLRSRIVLQDIETIKNQIPMIQSALTQIAGKMNAAGSCLSFGF